MVMGSKIPNALEAVLYPERTGRDIGKVLQRYIFTLTTFNEKLQYSSLIAQP
jgi:hypothetical protein